MGGNRNIRKGDEAVGAGLVCVLCLVGLAIMGLVTYDGKLFPWPNLGGIALMLTSFRLLRTK